MYLQNYLQFFLDDDLCPRDTLHVEGSPDRRGSPVLAGSLHFFPSPTNTFFFFCLDFSSMDQSAFEASSSPPPCVFGPRGPLWCSGFGLIQPVFSTGPTGFIRDFLLGLYKSTRGKFEHFFLLVCLVYPTPLFSLSLTFWTSWLTR